MIMEEELTKVRAWAKRGTMKQFYTDLAAKLEPHGYVAELAEDTINIYRVEKPKGMLARPKKAPKTQVLAIQRQNASVAFDQVNEDFVRLLARLARS